MGLTPLCPYLISYLYLSPRILLHTYYSPARLIAMFPIRWSFQAVTNTKKFSEKTLLGLPLTQVWASSIPPTTDGWGQGTRSFWSPVVCIPEAETLLRQGSLWELWPFQGSRDREMWTRVKSHCTNSSPHSWGLTNHSFMGSFLKTP